MTTAAVRREGDVWTIVGREETVEYYGVIFQCREDSATQWQDACDPRERRTFQLSGENATILPPSVMWNAYKRLQALFEAGVG